MQTASGALVAALRMGFSADVGDLPSAICRHRVSAIREFFPVLADGGIEMPLERPLHLLEIGETGNTDSASHRRTA
jgi:hypothetical protein